MKKNNFQIISIGVILLSLALVAMGMKAEVGKEYNNRIIHSFKLQTFGGQSFSSQQLKSNVWVADFIYLGCVEDCATLSGVIHQLQLKFHQYPNLKFVSFVIDGNNALMKSYAKRYHANLKAWYFLTGPIQKIDMLARKSFRITKKPLGNFFMSPDLILINAHDQVIGVFNGTSTQEVKSLIQHIQHLL